MANDLTGDYEAVLQISVQQINGILATMHQNKVTPNASPTFEHSSPGVRLGDLPKILQSDTYQFAKWVGVSARELRDAGIPASEVRTRSEKTPPGLSEMFQKAWLDLEAAHVEPVASGAVRGSADVQLSTPTISLDGGSAAEVTVHVFVRANYVPDGGSAMPDPIHGEVQATYIVKPKKLGAGSTLSVQVSPHDNQIIFKPEKGTGLTAADADNIAVQVRKALRNQFAVVDIQLPDGFPFTEFTALGGGSGQALALPLQLSGASLPAGSISSITNLFLGGKAFAIGVSSEYVKTRFQPTLDRLRHVQRDFTAPITGIGFADPTYHLSVNSADLRFQSGALNLEIKAKATTNHIVAPNFNNIVINQRITLVLNGQSISLQALDSDLTISGAPSQARNQVIDERNKALNPLPPGARPEQGINDTLQSARTQLTNALKSFVLSDRFAAVNYTALEVTPAGIVLRGSIGPSGPGWRSDPVVHAIETAEGFTAFDSWIPGGRIEEYRWTWPLGGGGSAGINLVVASKIGSKSDKHRFVFPTPPEVAQTGRICLRIQGTRISPDGFEEQVDAGETCKPWWSEPILVAPYGSLDVLEPIWNPPVVEQTPDFILGDAIAGHVNVVGQSPISGGLTTNTLIHFAGRNIERPLETLSQGFSRMRQPRMSLVLILVLPAGTFAMRRGELEERLGSLGERFAMNVRITEDYLGGWSKAFAAREGPSTHLINARGEFVWKHEGGLEPEVLGAALNKHLLPAPAPRSVLLGLTVKPGERAPDGLFQDDQGGQMSLRRLRGKRVLLNFWKSWSAPCIRELRRLQTLQDQRNGRASVVVAINGGEDRDVLAEVRRQNNLTFPLIIDPGQLVGALYGVQCWPTTISINEEGVIDRIQFGLTHEPQEQGEYPSYQTPPDVTEPSYPAAADRAN